MSNTGKPKRNNTIDAMKGFGIILVVLGHVIQGNITVPDNNIIYRYIYSFHMPLFMFLSGYVAYITNNKINNNFLFIKTKELFVPFISWYFTIGFLLANFEEKIYLSTYLKELIFFPDNGLWFLWILFLIFCIYFFIKKINEKLFNNNNFSELILILITCLNIRFLTLNILGISLLKWHIIFFFIGYLVARYKYKFVTCLPRVVYISISVIFLLLGVFLSKDVQSLFTNFMSGYLENNIKYLLVIYSYIVALAGIVFSYFIVGIIRKYRLYKYILFLGKNSIDIYILHLYVLKVFHFNGSTIGIILSTLFALAASMIFSRLILRRNVILSYIYLGK